MAELCTASPSKNQYKAARKKEPRRGPKLQARMGPTTQSRSPAAGQRRSEASQASDVAHQATVAQRRWRRPKVERRVGDPLRCSTTTLHHKPSKPLLPLAKLRQTLDTLPEYYCKLTCPHSCGLLGLTPGLSWQNLV
ncbi:Hypothetical predicted protein [Pelobates cultripes]|uniref:Uncharacterized protein n=1 Tax=Pelobates cultripes TaxID=61616 RepID=A0AAD1VT66_PELCU|nr:Hypothetical predicted protein [Pelobates cultripes]